MLCCGLSPNGISMQLPQLVLAPNLMHPALRVATRAFQQSAGLEDAYQAWEASVTSLAGLLVPFEVEKTHVDTGFEGPMVLSVHALACMFLLWPLPLLNRGLAHLQSLGLELGASPDVLSGLSFFEGHNPAGWRALSGVALAAGQREKDAPPWSALVQSQLRLCRLRQDHLDRESAFGGIWDVIECRQDFLGDRDFLEMLRLLLDSGISLDPAGPFFQNLVSRWLLSLGPQEQEEAISGVFQPLMVSHPRTVDLMEQAVIQAHACWSKIPFRQQALGPLKTVVDALMSQRRLGLILPVHQGSRVEARL